MRGAWVVAVVAIASSAWGQPNDVSARTTAPDGFLTVGPAPFTDTYSAGLGRASLNVEGGTARLSAHLDVDGVRYAVAMSFAAPAPPSTLFLDLDVQGDSVWPFPLAPHAHAAVVVSGRGAVTRDDQIISETAAISAVATTASAHARDGTHRQLPQALAGSLGIDVLAQGLPPDRVPGGFLQLGFDGVEIDVGGIPVACVPDAELSEQASSLQAALTPLLYAGGALLLAPPPGVPQSPVPPEATSAASSALSTEIVPLNAQPAMPSPAGIVPLNASPSGIVPLHTLPAAGAGR
jgi:hypothetical protein